MDSTRVNTRVMLFDMTQFAEDVSRSVMGRITEARKKAGLSGAALAEACTAVGLPMPRNVVANLESGRRTTLTVAELVAFAHVLDVPLVELLYGVDALPEPSALALPAGSAVSAAELIAGAVDDVRVGDAAAKLTPLRLLRELAQAENDLVLSMRGEGQRYDLTADMPEDERRAVVWMVESGWTRSAAKVARYRFALRMKGLQPPELHPTAAEGIEMLGGGEVLAWLRQPVTPEDAARREEFEELVEKTFAVRRPPHAEG